MDIMEFKRWLDAEDEYAARAAGMPTGAVEFTKSLDDDTGTRCYIEKSGDGHRVTFIEPDGRELGEGDEIDVAQLVKSLVPAIVESLDLNLIAKIVRERLGLVDMDVATVARAFNDAVAEAVANA
jgi:hypothetical protein